MRRPSRRGSSTPGRRVGAALSFECPECGADHGVWIGETLFGGVGRCQECGDTFNVTEVKLEWDEWSREEWADAELQPGDVALSADEVDELAEVLEDCDEVVKIATDEGHKGAWEWAERLRAEVADE